MLGESPAVYLCAQHFSDDETWYCGTAIAVPYAKLHKVLAVTAFFAPTENHFVTQKVRRFHGALRLSRKLSNAGLFRFSVL